MATPKRIQIETHEAETLDLGDLQALTGLPSQILRDSAETHGWHVLNAHGWSTRICLESARWPRR